MQIDDIRAFTWVALSGSLSRTARERGIAKATLSHRLRRLESELGAALLSRTPSGLLLTDAGLTFLQHAQEVDQAYTRAHDAMAGQRPTGSVRLRVGATDELGTNLLAPLGLQFTQSRPEIALDLQIMPKSRLFLPDSDLDCMICAGLPAAEEGGDLIARGFAHYVSRLYASPDYIGRRGMPARVDDLPLHDVVANAASVGSVSWSLTDDATQRLIEPTGPLHTNDNWVAKVCVIQGKGIGLFPEFFAQEHVLAGDLVEVLPNWHTAPTAISILHHGHRFANPHIREFIDFLAADFKGFTTSPIAAATYCETRAEDTAASTVLRLCAPLPSHNSTSTL